MKQYAQYLSGIISKYDLQMIPPVPVHRAAPHTSHAVHFYSPWSWVGFYSFLKFIWRHLFKKNSGGMPAAHLVIVVEIINLTDTLFRYTSK